MDIALAPRIDRPYPPHLADRARELLHATCAVFGGDPRAAAPARHVLAKYPVHARQIAEEAAALGVDPADLAVGNLCYDLLMGTMGCSTMALATPEGPVLARNMDWFPAEKIAKASCLVPTAAGVSAGFAGLVGVVTGMSERGFALALNAVFGGSDPHGYPTLLFLRHVLDEAGGYDEAVAMVTRERLMSGALVTVVGTTNDQRAVIERTPTQAMQRDPYSGGVLCATNHYRALGAPEPCGRYAHVSAHAGRVPPLEVLTHPSVLQEITAQHVVLQPAARRAELYVPARLLPDGVREELSRDDVLRMLFG